MTGFRNLVLAVVAMAVIAGFALGGKSFLANSQSGTETQSADARNADTQIIWSHGRDGAQANAEEHWEKHGREFPEFRNAHEYAAGALRFVNHPPQGTLTRSRDNGDTLFYDPATNTFAVKDRRGEPRTFFRPQNGRAYWERQ